jgi:superfamily II DNA or RNA helicase
MSNKNKENQINLKINGRLFPSWIAANFKEYKLPKIILDEGDPCNKAVNLELKQYQKFIGKYLDFNSNFKNILIFHGLGSGKTATAINLYNVLYNYTPGWNVFVLLKATLKDNWMRELERFLEKDDKEQRKTNIVFISYDSPIADKTFMEEIRKSDSSKRNFFVIEESHNFISNVYSNIGSNKGKRAQNIYDYIVQDQLENSDTRVIALSATPAINNPYEIALLFNLLRPGIFPKSETLFNQEFVSSASYKLLNPLKKNQFQRRIMGLVSYYIGSTPDFFASKTIEYIYVKMSKYQEDIYSYFEEIEERLAKKKKAKQSSSETYKSYTRQASNFVFPFLGQGLSGENRPRPKDFSLAEKIGQQIDKGKLDKKDEKDKGKYYDANDYLEATQKYVDLFENYIDGFATEDEKNKYTVMDDFKVYKEKYDSDFEKFNKKENKKSKVYEELYKCSAKFLNAVFIILDSKGPVLVYTNYVLMEGIQIFKIYLKYFDFSSLNMASDTQTGKDYFRYTEYHGGILKENRGKVLEKFNQEENKYGKVCFVILLSAAGTEGVNLMSVRRVILMESYWNTIRLDQAIGRAVRLCSHRYLPLNERHVDVYHLRSVRENYPNAKQTTDLYIDSLSRAKSALIESFQEAMKEVAVDCVLYKNHNMLTQDYKCFNFSQESAFAEQVSAAYKEDLNDDSKIDDGLNAPGSQVVKIKIIKIMAVKQLTNTEPIKYSEPTAYYYHQDSQIVYDFDLQFAVGKVGVDPQGIPLKLDKNTYIITKLVPIPIIKQTK